MKLGQLFDILTLNSRQAPWTGKPIAGRSQLQAGKPIAGRQANCKQASQLQAGKPIADRSQMQAGKPIADRSQMQAGKSIASRQVNCRQASQLQTEAKCKQEAIASMQVCEQEPLG